MLRGILIIALYGTGTLLSLHGIAYACSFFIWSEIFRPIHFARKWVEFPAAYIVVAVLLVSLFLHRWHRRWNQVATVLCALIGWMFLSTIFAQFGVVAMAQTTEAIKYLIPLILISISLVTRFSQNLFVFTLAASVGIWAAQAGVHCLMSGNPEIRMSIPGGQMSDRNDFMVATVACLPLLAYVGWAYAWRYQRLVRLAAKFMLAMCVMAVFFSLSRGAVLGIACLLLYYTVATGRFGKRLVIGAVVVLVGLMLLPGFVGERMSTLEMDTDYQSEGSAASRLSLLKAGLNMALDHPIVGVGPDNFKYVVGSYGHWSQHDPHSIWLKAAGEYGFPMVILFVLLVVLILRRLGQEARQARIAGDRETELLGTALACSLVGFLATGTFTSQFLSEYLWAILCVSGAFLARQDYLRRNTARLDTKVETGTAQLEESLVG